jgi:hypothetical protein
MWRFPPFVYMYITEISERISIKCSNICLRCGIWGFHSSGYEECLPSGKWRVVTLYKFTDISENLTGSIFKNE